MSRVRVGSIFASTAVLVCVGAFAVAATAAPRATATSGHPTVASFTPESGFTGSSVTISGSDFVGITKVTFGGVSAGFSVLDGSTIKATVPAAAAVGPISVTNGLGSGWSADAFTVLPKATGFTPTLGTAGTSITVTGTGLAGTTGAAFAGVDAPVVSASATSVVVKVPDTAGVGPISLTTPAASATTTASFMPTPKLKLASPAPAQAGDTVTIAGSNLQGASALKLGGLPLPFTLDGPTQLTATLPLSAVTGSLRVTTPGGSSTGLQLGVRPTIDSLSTDAGAPGTSVTITGNTFLGTTSVTFGSPTALALFTLVDSRTLKATVPSSAVSGPITVTNAGGSTASSQPFTVRPKINGFSPSSGVAGTSVTINGNGLAGASEVSFGGADGTIVSASANRVVAKVPADAVSGPISVTAPGGTATSSGVFKPTPALSLVTPSPAQAGDTVTILGSNLSGATALKLGSTALPFTVDSATQLTATLPADALTGSLTVTTPGGTGAGLFLGVRPTITSFTPTSAARGATVTIDGATFTGTTKVTFGSPSASATFTRISNNQLQAVVPSSAVDGPITVTNAGGSTTSSDSFTVAGGGGGNGTIVPTQVFSGGTDVDASSFVTQSWTPQANRLYLLSLSPVQDFGERQPTVSGNGLTWVPIAGGEFGGQGSGRQLWMFRAMGSSPASGPITINFGGKTQFTIAWSLDGFSGVDTSGTNGSGAVVQHLAELPASSSKSLTFSLSPFASPNDLAFACFGHAEHENTVPGSGWTELSDFGPNTTPITIQLETEYKLNTTSVSASWASFNTGGGIGVELRAA